MVSGKIIIILAVPCENVFWGIRGQRRPRSACAVCSGPSLSTNGVIGYYRIYDWRVNFAYAQNDRNLLISSMFESTFSLDTAHLTIKSSDMWADLIINEALISVLTPEWTPQQRDPFVRIITLDSVTSTIVRNNLVQEFTCTFGYI